MTQIGGFADIRTAAVLGLGLIGGSLARDLRARGVRVLAWDQNRLAVQAAKREGVAEPLAWHGRAKRLEPVDLVVLALPVLAAPEVLGRLAPALDGVRLITDAGSTKTSIVRAAEALGIGDRFVGSHPLAGDHRSGWAASRAGLFDGARVFLCPTRSASDGSMRLASALWAGVGARTEVVDADLHDVQLAWTSHLPQVVSTALGLTLRQPGMAPGQLGPGGRDVARLAGSDPAMWADILLDNADALDSALAMMHAQLSGLHRAVAAGDREALVRMLAQAQAWHRSDG